MLVCSDDWRLEDGGGDLREQAKDRGAPRYDMAKKAGGGSSRSPTQKFVPTIP